MREGGEMDSLGERLAVLAGAKSLDRNTSGSWLEPRLFRPAMV